VGGFRPDAGFIFHRSSTEILKGEIEIMEQTAKDFRDPGEVAVRVRFISEGGK